MRGFEKLIQDIPKNYSVLDVGAGALQGANTTNDLIKHFGTKNYLGICLEQEKIDTFISCRKLNREPIPTIIAEDFYLYTDVSPDVLVIDLNLDNNLNNEWSDTGIHRAYELTKQYYITYVMSYNVDLAINERVTCHAHDFWGTLPITNSVIRKKLKEYSDLFEVIAIEKDDPRDEILWVKLKKV